MTLHQPNFYELSAIKEVDNRKMYILSLSTVSRGLRIQTITCSFIDSGSKWKFLYNTILKDFSGNSSVIFCTYIIVVILFISFLFDRIWADTYQTTYYLIIYIYAFRPPYKTKNCVLQLLWIEKLLYFYSMQYLCTNYSINAVLILSFK